MAIRKVESRLPAGFSLDDLGESISSGSFYLVSYLTSPIRGNELNSYVIYCTNIASGDMISYEWLFYENSVQVHSHGTTIGYIEYKSNIVSVGELIVVVKIYNNGTLIQELSLVQEVGRYNAQAEVLLDNHIIPSGPLIALGGDSVTTKEIIYDFRKYIDLASLDTGNNGIHSLLLASFVYKESVFRPKTWKASMPQIVGPYLRNYELALVAQEIEGEEGIIGRHIDQSDSSLGVCQVKRSAAAMTLGLIPWQELPAEKSERETVRKEILSYYENLTDDQKIDLYNLLRFPKANIMLCSRLLVEIKNRNYSSTDRWAGLTKEDTLENEEAIELIGTEYNLGATSTPKDEARATDYGADIYILTGSPFLRPFFLEPSKSVSEPLMTTVLAHTNGWRNETRINGNIDSIVIHTIEGTATAGILWFQDANSGVSAHYVVSKEGHITQMVEIEDVAFTSNYYNDRSISIECEGFANQQITWTNSLMSSLAHLIAWCCYKYEIPPYHSIKLATGNTDKLDERGIVGHNQIHGYAPYNKNDPGSYFRWNQLISDIHKVLVGLE